MEGEVLVRVAHFLFFYERMAQFVNMSQNAINPINLYAPQTSYYQRNDNY